LRRKPSEFQLRLTHDVDQPWSAWGRSTGTVVRSIGVDILRRRDLELAWQRTIALRDARTGRIDRDPFNTFRFLMETSEQHGLRSTFYFLAGNTPTEYDFRYSLSDPVFVPLLREIHERGHEIGLHASYSSYLSSDRIAFEFKALVAVCSGLHIDQADWGVRQHYLRFEVPMTWRSQASAGLGYDSTVGFNDRIGFRAGTCREFPVFDLEQREALALHERPLLVMDVTLMEQLGQGWSSARTEIITICAAARRVNGNAVLLFHNNTLATGYARRQYQDLVHDLVRS
jgi:hypothetical protein